MKLTLKKKLGHIHVRGGRLLRVVHAHPVETKNRCEVAGELKTRTLPGTKPYEPKHSPGANATARPGDLAIEIVTVKTGTVMGYSFISGAAIQCNCYQLRPDRYEEAVLAAAFLPNPPASTSTAEEVRQYFHSFRKACVDMKFNREVDVFVLDLAIGGGANPGDDDAAAQDVAETIIDSYKLIPKELPDSATDDNRSHLLGIIRAKQHYLLHCQPKKAASNYAVTVFHAGLCITALAARQQQS